MHACVNKESAGYMPELQKPRKGAGKLQKDYEKVHTAYEKASAIHNNTKKPYENIQNTSAKCGTATGKQQE